MWEMDISGQVYTLLDSLLTGAVFCLVFDLYFALCRRLRLKRVTVFLSDVILLSLIGVFDFLLFLAHCNGEIRLYVFLSQLAGFFVCKKTLSRLFVCLINAVFGFFNVLHSFAKRRILEPSVLLLNNFFKKIGFTVRKSAFFLKKRLKKPD